MRSQAKESEVIRLRPYSQTQQVSLEPHGTPPAHPPLDLLSFAFARFGQKRLPTASPAPGRLLARPPRHFFFFFFSVRPSRPFSHGRRLYIPQVFLFLIFSQKAALKRAFKNTSRQGKRQGRSAALLGLFRRLVSAWEIFRSSNGHLNHNQA